MPLPAPKEACMNPKLKESIAESLSAVLPITGIVLAISIFLVPMETGTMVMFFVGAVMLIVGMGMFQLGSEMAMSPLGEGIGAETAKSKKIAVLLFAVIVGSLLELLSVSIFTPFVNIIMNQDSIQKTWYLKWLYDLFGFHSNKGFLGFLSVCIMIVYVLKNVYLILERSYMFKFSYITQKNL